MRHLAFTRHEGKEAPEATAALPSREGKPARRTSFETQPFLAFSTTMAAKLSLYLILPLRVIPVLEFIPTTIRQLSGFLLTTFAVLLRRMETAFIWLRWMADFGNSRPLNNAGSGALGIACALPFCRTKSSDPCGLTQKGRVAPASFALVIIAAYFTTIRSYSRVPRPIFSACSIQVRHSDSGPEFLKWSW